MARITYRDQLFLGWDSVDLAGVSDDALADAMDTINALRIKVDRERQSRQNPRIKGEKHWCSHIPDKILEQAVRFAREGRLRQVEIQKILREEGYNVSLSTLSLWVNRKKRTSAPEYDHLFT